MDYLGVDLTKPFTISCFRGPPDRRLADLHATLAELYRLAPWLHVERFGSAETNYVIDCR